MIFCSSFTTSMISGSLAYLAIADGPAFFLFITRVSERRLSTCLREALGLHCGA